MTESVAPLSRLVDYGAGSRVVLHKSSGAWRRCRFGFPAAPTFSLKGWQIVAVPATNQPTLKGSNSRRDSVCDHDRSANRRRRLKKGTGTSAHVVLRAWNGVGLGARPLFQRTASALSMLICRAGPCGTVALRCVLVATMQRSAYREKKQILRKDRVVLALFVNHGRPPGMAEARNGLRWRSKTLQAAHGIASGGSIGATRPPVEPFARKPVLARQGCEVTRVWLLLTASAATHTKLKEKDK